MVDRYSRQILFPGIGREGQEKLGRSFVVIIGCGALGSIIATSLVRAGVGSVRIIDRDLIEYNNLHRQVLFDEEDVQNQLPKAVAAERHLSKVNSSVKVEGIVADVNYANIEKFVHGADVILDALDNLETRYLINDVSLKARIPWVYGGVVASYGMTMDVIPGETACFRCLSPKMPSTGLTCDTAGVINAAPFTIGSLQSVEAIKILTGAKEINRDLLFVDVWKGTFNRLKIRPRPDCPACQGKYEFLEGQYGLRASSLCGQNAVQVVSPNTGEISLDLLAQRLEALGEINRNEFMLRFAVDGYEMFIFPDGRAIVKNTDDESVARGLYAKYIGS